MSYEMKRIMVPVAVGTLKGYELARKATDAAFAISKKSDDARVILLFKSTKIDDIDPNEATGKLFNNARDTLKKHMADAVERLEELEKYGDSLGVEYDIEVVADDESTADTICAAALRLDVDAIVMCSHGRTGFKRFMIGSVAEEVVRKAEVPVMVLKGKQIEDA